MLFVCLFVFVFLFFRYCFVQFSSYFSASNAISSLNGTDLQGRTVQVDWATPRTQNRTSRNQTAATEVSTEGERDEGSSEEGEETDSEVETGQEEGGDDDDDDDDDDDGDGDDGDDGDGDDGDDDDNVEEEEEYLDSDEDSDMEEDRSNPHLAAASASKPPLRKSKHQDVAEGRTVFIRQVLINTTLKRKWLITT